MDADTHALWTDMLGGYREVSASSIAQLRWMCGFQSYPVPTDEEVRAECGRRGQAAPDDLDMDPAMFTPGAYGPPERRAENARLEAELRRGEGEHVDLG